MPAIHELERVRAVRDIADRAIHLCDDGLGRLQRAGLVAQGPTKEACQADAEYRLAVILNLLFGFDLFKSIVRLEQSGSFLPANILARSLFEAMVNLLYIGTDPGKLAHRFFTYEYAERYKFLGLVQKRGHRSEPRVEREIERDWEAVRDVHGRGKSKSKPRDNWRGGDLCAICCDPAMETAGAPKKDLLQREYDLYYRPDSALCHASVSALRSYAMRDPGGPGWILGPEDSPWRRAALLGRSLGHFIAIVRVADGVFKLGISEPLQRLGVDTASVFQRDSLDPRCPHGTPHAEPR